MPENIEEARGEAGRDRYSDDEPVIRTDRVSVVVWSLGTGLLLAGISFIVVAAVRGWQDGIKLAMVGFGLGMMAGVAAASVDYLPRNPYYYLKPSEYLDTISRKTEENEGRPDHD